MEGFGLQGEEEVGARRQGDVETILLDILKTKEIYQPKCIVIAGVLLIVCSDPRKIPVGITCSVVVLIFDVWLARTMRGCPAEADYGCPGVNGVIAIAPALQVSHSGSIEARWQF